jgi:hypothetical protein
MDAGVASDAPPLVDTGVASDALSPRDAHVSACDALGDAGGWETISPTLMTPDVWTGAIVVDPFDPAVVWIGADNAALQSDGYIHPTGGGGVYRSNDCGASWTLVSTGRNGDAIAMAAPSSMVLDPADQGVIYATAGSGSSGNAGVWKSTNGGVDWDNLLPAGSEFSQVVQYNLANSIGMEAANPKHLVVSTHADCMAPYGPVCEAETTDGGATWTMTTVEIPGQTQWVAGAGAYILDDSRWLFSTYSAGLWLTTDHGKPGTWTNVTAQGSSGVTSGKVIVSPFLPAADHHYYLGSYEGVVTSADGVSWSLLPGLAGRVVGVTSSPDQVFVADQWAPSFHAASFSDLSTWSSLDAPMTLGPSDGAPYLAYDAAHHVLYASTWGKGLARRVF